MKFTLKRASDYYEKNTKEIDVNSIDDLKEIVKDEIPELIVRFDYEDIIIYDDWIE